jgi:DNA modification methylase
VWVELEIIRQQLVWVKDSMVLGHSDYHYKHEPILYGWKPGEAHYFTKDRTKVTTLEFDRPKASLEHPTMKPVSLWAELIQNSSRPGDVVLDTFLGSGTTLIACEELNRICFGFEIEPQYCEVIVQRYKKLCEKNSKPFDCRINGVPYSAVFSSELLA